jgi:uncharacterized membrane protein
MTVILARLLRTTLEAVITAGVVLVCFIVVTGGFEVNPGGAGISLKLVAIDKPVALLLVLVLVYWRIFGSTDLEKIRVFRMAESLLGRIDRLLGGRHGRVAAFGFLACYGHLLFATSARRYWAYRSGTSDMGIPYQTIWNTLQGHFWISALKGDVNLFVDHTEPFYFLFLPFVAIFKTPLVIVYLQCLWLASGAVPLFLVARDRLKSRRAAWVIGLVYLTYRPFRNLAIYDYHAIAFVIPLLFWAFYFLIRKQHRRFAVTALVALSCKETVGPVVAGMGLVLLVERRWRIGVATLILGAAVFVFDIKMVPGFFGHAFYYNRLYSHLGDNLFQVALSPVLRPRSFFGEFLQRPVLDYLIALFAPLAFLPLLSPRWLVPAVPAFLQVILASGSQKLGVGHHHTAELMPFLFISTILSLAQIETWEEKGFPRRWPNWKITRGAAGWAVILLVANALFYGRSEVARIRGFDRDDHVQCVADHIDRLVPADAAVTANTCIAAHLLNREHIYRLPFNLDKANYVVFDQRFCADEIDAGEADAIRRVLAEEFVEEAGPCGLSVYRRLRPVREFPDRLVP